MSEPLIGAEESAELLQAMSTKYANFLEGRTFQLKTEHDEKAVYVTITLLNGDQSFYYPVESRINFVEEELTNRRAALFLIDYIDLYFEDFLAEGEDLFIPIDWTEFEYDTVKFQMRGQILNLKVESMADALLAQSEKPESGHSH